MEEIKFNESNTESSKHDNTANKKLTNIVVITVAILFGLTVFIIMNILFNKDNNTNKTTSISIDSKEVKGLYNIVTFKELGMRTSKFMESPQITRESLSNYGKYTLALSLANENDFKETGKTNNKLKEYALDKDKLDEYMKKFFGSSINYSINSSVEHTFNFEKDGYNTGTLEYNQDDGKYLIYFTKKVNEVPNTLENNRFFAELYKAEKVGDSINLYEKIVYTACTKNPTNNYNCKLYKDYNRSEYIDTLKGIDASTTKINFDDIKETSEIIYTFKKDIDNYYFSSSKSLN
ncbi:MAG: hypothetical protein IJI43_00340 [Bacilli bacterium]|nr:hypothetical protein [Bacilli bacterium]